MRLGFFGMGVARRNPRGGKDDPRDGAAVHGRSAGFSWQPALFFFFFLGAFLQLRVRWDEGSLG